MKGQSQHITNMLVLLEKLEPMDGEEYEYKLHLLLSPEDGLWEAELHELVSGHVEQMLPSYDDPSELLDAVEARLTKRLERVAER